MSKYMLPALVMLLGTGGSCFADAPSSNATPAASKQTAVSPAPNSAAAAASTTTTTTTTTPASVGTNVPASARSLNVGVRKVELSLEKLRDVGLDLKHLMKSASSLYDEVAIRPVQLMTQPEVIGTTVINVPIGVQPIGPMQPPRKDRLDLAMNSVRPIVVLLKTNVDEFVSGEQQLDLTEDVLDELKPKLQEWIARVNELSIQEKQLETLTAGPEFDNSKIADGAVTMEKNVKELDATRRDIYKVLRKHGRRVDKKDK